MIKRVYVRTDFLGFHQWPAAPACVDFLRNLHRHKFGVKVSVFVEGSDREVEFFMLQKEVRLSLTHVITALKQNPCMSCEMMAENLGESLRKLGYRVASVEINEDNENGSIIEWPEEPVEVVGGCS